MKRAMIQLWAGAALALSVVPICAAYAAWWAVPVLIACALVPIGLVAIGRWAKLAPLWIGLGLVALGVVASVAAADQGIESDPVWWRQSPGLRYLGPLIDSVPRLLTAPDPAPPQIGYLVPAALFTWLVATCVALATSAHSRARIAPLVAAMALHLAGALLTAGRGDPYGLLAAATIAVILIGWNSTPARSEKTGSRPLAGAWLVSAGAAVIVAALALTGAALTTGDGFQPRTLIPAPQQQREAANPLPNVTLWNSQADQVLFTLTPEEGGVPEKIRLAVLPDFDGAAWTLAARLRQVGVVDTPDLPAPQWQSRRRYHVSLTGKTGLWIPSLGRTTELSGGRALMGLDTGILVSQAPPGASETFDITTVVPSASEEAVARAGAPPTQEAARYLALPRLPAELLEDAQSHTDGISSRWQQVLALADYIRGDRTLDRGAPSGSSYGRIAEFLYSPRSQGGQVGTTEQFAASLAVMARAVGIPSRLVVGFDLKDAPRNGNEVAVTGKTARVWTQVYLARVGWVTIDPSPDSGVMTDHTPPPAENAGSDKVPTATPAPSASATKTQTQAATPVTASGPGAGLGWISLAAALAIAIVLAGLAGLRAKRRLGWKQAGARGAWAQALDAMALADIVAPAGDTALDMARDVDEQAGTELAMVAAAAEAEAFGPAGTPNPGERAGAEDRWPQAVSAERVLRKQASWVRRLVWFVSPAVWGKKLRGRG